MTPLPSWKADDVNCNVFAHAAFIHAAEARSERPHPSILALARGSYVITAGGRDIPLSKVARHETVIADRSTDITGEIMFTPE